MYHIIKYISHLTSRVNLVPSNPGITMPNIMGGKYVARRKIHRYDIILI